LIRIKAPHRGFRHSPAMPQNPLILKLALALVVKLAIVGAALYWLWPVPQAPQPPQRVGAVIITLPHSG
jgi:hypothetical protein